MEQATTKSGLLALLLQAQREGRALSGEAAAEQLGVTRAAVSKAVKRLRGEGLCVQATAGSGYRIADSSAFLSAEALRAFLPPSCCAIRVHDELESTNLAAKQWAMQGAPHGALVAARRQSAGRGRAGRGFASPPGGLYFSVVLRPALPLDTAALITSAAAVAVCGAAEALCGLQLGIKWVNDVYLGAKKCCGILTEAAGGLENGQVDYMVVGIGINHTTAPDAFPDAYRDIATSLYPGGGAPVPGVQLLAGVYTRLLEYCAGLPGTAFLRDYRRRSLALGRRVTVMSATPYEALALDVDGNARLVVRKDDGTTAALSSGEIAIRLS